ncbi:hypothetical protein B0J18DRAFT_363896, partial [Chaetomium sp. MPI-SDFR-AT-0129]
GLARLPTELFDKILFEVDTVRDLACFMATARFVYRGFRIQRRDVLFRVLHNELGPVLDDARFLFVFPYRDAHADQAAHIQWLRLMAVVYHRMLRDGKARSGMPVRGSDAVPSLNELTGLCRTLYKLNFLADVYVRARLAMFDLAGGGDTPATAPLSVLERQRLMRGFYRHQIMSNAWAATQRPHSGWSREDAAAISNSSTHQGDELGLFGTLEPWELQHIDHVDVFITRLCFAFVHFCPRTPDGAPVIRPREFDNLIVHQDSLVQYLQTHPRFAEMAVRDLPTGKEAARSAHLWDKYVNVYQMIPLRCSWQGAQAHDFPNPVTDKWQRDGLAVPYLGDGLDLVPYGWADGMGGRYFGQFGECLETISWLPRWQSDRQSFQHGENMRLWVHAGFSLWDRKRVDALKKLPMFAHMSTGWVLRRLAEES